MFEILWHGRGGQGAFTAARLVGAAACLNEEVHALAFPSFGPERRGAPVRAFTKIDSKPIGDRSEIKKADVVIYLDHTLVGKNWKDELKENGLMLVNSPFSYQDPSIIALDADGLSKEYIGRIMPNTAFLGALAAISDLITLEQITTSITNYMAKSIQDSNIATIKAAHEKIIEILNQRSEDGSSSRDGLAFDVAAEIRSDEETPRRESLGYKSIIPRFHDEAQKWLNPKEYSRTTCFEAGFLVSKNADWRNVRPSIDQSLCTGCLQCYLYCPDGTIYKVNKEKLSGPLQDQIVVTNGKPREIVAIDYDFCKGCGICAKICPADAIAMVVEP